MAIDKIKWRINKVLPLVYDDTLSYYETLCKVIAKCNEVIEEINELTAEVNSQGIQIAQLGQRMTTAETNIGILQTNVAEHANELGILIPKVQLLEQEIADIPTYTAGTGADITNAEISVIGNSTPMNINDIFEGYWTTGGEETITDETLLAWIARGGALRKADGCIFQLINDGNTFYTYVGSDGTAYYRLRLNKNTNLMTLVVNAY